MGIDLRIPSINATTAEGQQIRSYLIQLVEQLNYAFNSISNSGETMDSYRATMSESSGSSSEEEASNTFTEIKSLIIKSADIVKAYYEQMDLLYLKGEYVAESDFGKYKEETSAAIVANATSIEQKYTNLQEVIDELNATVGKISSNASIKSGLLGYDKDGLPIFGIQLGQSATDEVTGEEIFNKVARLTSAGGLELFSDANSDAPSAVFKHNTMYIANANITQTLKLGGYNIETTKGLAFKWAGRGE